MVKTITFPYILTVSLTYFLATVIISAINEDRNIIKKQKYKETRKDLVRGVDPTQHKNEKIITTFKET